MRAPPHEIISDGKTVWVNGAEGLLGRFGRGGIDVHRPAVEQAETGRECLHCTHTAPTAADWDVFVLKMKEHHGIEVGNAYRPKKLKKLK